MRCGTEDLVLVFLNPDLDIREDGFVHASGTFFIQFQARGPVAEQIEKFTFSFGKSVPESTLRRCDAPEPITDVYIKNYRSDTNWRDGFFVPINTYNVGDGEYAAAVSAYDANGNELVRYFTKAKVENGGRQTGQDPWPVTDFTQPWPMIIPGDGDLPDGESGLYIEIAEKISEIKAYVNNVPIQLTEVEGIPRDDDLIPDLCYPGVPNVPTLSCEAQYNNRVWGPRYHWDGRIRDEDIVKVRVTDMWGNVAEKVVHIGDPTIGGRVNAGLPKFTIDTDKARKVASENGTAVFNVTYKMQNSEFLHGDVYLRAAGDRPLPQGFTAKLSPNHVMLGPNEELRGNITVNADNTVNPGDYPLTVVVEYLAGESRSKQYLNITYVLMDRSKSTGEKEEFASKSGVESENFRGTKQGATDTKAREFPKEENTPGPGAFAAALVATLVAIVVRRRRAT